MRNCGRGEIPSPLMVPHFSAILLCLHFPSLPLVTLFPYSESIPSFSLGILFFSSHYLSQFLPSHQLAHSLRFFFPHTTPPFPCLATLFALSSPACWFTSSLLPECQMKRKEGWMGEEDQTGSKSPLCAFSRWWSPPPPFFFFAWHSGFATEKNHPNSAGSPTPGLDMYRFCSSLPTINKLDRPLNLGVFPRYEEPKIAYEAGPLHGFFKKQIHTAASLWLLYIKLLTFVFRPYTLELRMVWMCDIGFYLHSNSVRQVRLEECDWPCHLNSAFLSPIHSIPQHWIIRVCSF